MSEETKTWRTLIICVTVFAVALCASITTYCMHKDKVMFENNYEYATLQGSDYPKPVKVR